MQVKETTVRLWLRRGLLRGVRIGHSWRVPQESLDLANEFAGAVVRTPDKKGER